MTTPNPTPPSLVAPIISTQGSTLAALALAGKAVASVANNQLQIMGATVTASASFALPNQTFSVYFDTDTEQKNPVQAHALDGNPPQIGSRVLCLLYPPRGVIVLGQISDAFLLQRSGVANGTGGLPAGTIESILQTFNGVSNPSGALYIQDDGGSIISTPMRTVQNLISNAGFNVTATGYTLPDASYAVGLPFPLSGYIDIAFYVQIAVSGAAGNQGLWAPEVRDSGPTGTILIAASDTFSAVSGTLQGSGSLSRTLRLAPPSAPASGNLWVSLLCRNTVAASNASSQRANIAVTPCF